MAKHIIISIIIIVLTVSGGFGSEFYDEVYTNAEKLMKHGNYYSAEREYKKLATVPDFKNRKEVFLRLGEIYLNYRDIDKLFNLSKAAIKEFPDSDYSYAGLSAAWALKAQKSTKITYKLQQARKALKFADEALKINGDCALAFYIQGMIHYNMPDFMSKLDDAIIEFEKILISRDLHKYKFMVDSFYYLARSHRRQRKTMKAIQILEQGLKFYPNFPPYLKLLIKYKSGMKKYKKINSK